MGSKYQEFTDDVVQGPGVDSRTTDDTSPAAAAASDVPTSPPVTATPSPSSQPVIIVQAPKLQRSFERYPSKAAVIFGGIQVGYTCCLLSLCCERTVLRVILNCYLKKFQMVQLSWDNPKSKRGYINLCSSKMRNLSVCWNSIFRKKNFKFPKCESVKLLYCGRLDFHHLASLRKLSFWLKFVVLRIGCCLNVGAFFAILTVRPILSVLNMILRWITFLQSAMWSRLFVNGLRLVYLVKLVLL